MDAKAFGQVLRDAGVRPFQAAELLGVPRSTITLWSKGREVIPGGRRAQVRQLPQIAAERRQPEPEPFLGPELRRLREAARLTQQELARKLLYTTQAAVSRWERTEVPADWREQVRGALADAFEPPALPRWSRDLRAARQAAGLRMCDVARAVGISTGAVAAWEAHGSRPRKQRREAVESFLAATWPTTA